MNCEESLISKVRNTIEKYKLLSINDHVVIGVSGGADSVCLLMVLNYLKEEYNLSISVAHVNHKIRPGAAERDAEFVKNLCEKLSLPFYQKTAYVEKLAVEKKISTEEAGREVRYDFFYELAGTSGKIITAHNKNDNVETVLMRLMRGTGINGLGGISFKRGQIVRPLLNVSRMEIDNFLKEIGIKHITDQTNFEPIYTRNKIRLNLIPEIQKEYNPKFIETLATNIELYREDSELLNEMAQNAYTQVFNSDYEFSFKTLLDFPVSIQKRVLIMAVQQISQTQQFSVPPQNINDILNMNNGSYSLKDNFCVSKNGDKGQIYRKVKIEQETEQNYNILLDSNAEINLRNYKVSTKELSVDSIVNTPTTCHIPSELFKSSKVELRNKRDGDIYRINDEMHKNLGDVLSDMKVPLEERKQILVVAIGNEVLFIPKFKATRFKQRNGNFVQIMVHQF